MSNVSQRISRCERKAFPSEEEERSGRTVLQRIKALEAKAQLTPPARNVGDRLTALEAHFEVIGDGDWEDAAV